MNGFQSPLNFDPPEGDRDGETYSHDRDFARLNAQQKRVWDAISDGRWYTLRLIAEATGDPEASVSARLRDFRKERFGSLVVERQNVGRGLWEYRVRRSTLLPVPESET